MTNVQDENRERNSPEAAFSSLRSVPQANGAAGNPDEEVTFSQEEIDVELKYGAEHVVKLFVPVTICLIFVVAVISTTPWYSKTNIYLLYTPFHETSDKWEDKLLDAVLNAAIVLTAVVVLTFALICLYLNRCYMIIRIWLGFSSLMLLSVFSMMFVVQILNKYNLGIDWITMMILSFNIGTVGMISIHWKGPLIVQQAYLIYIAALMSLMFIKYLPDYTLWAVLAAISVWDLIAVLCPRGPLRILVDTAQERNEQIFPALIYSSGVVYSTVAEDGATSSQQNQEEPPPTEAAAPVPKKRQRPKRPARRCSNDESSGFTQSWHHESHGRTQQRSQVVRVYIDNNPSEANRIRTQSEAHSEYVQDEEDQGVKLGLGDFIFYSILVGKASYYGDWNTTVACFIAILIGLSLTLVLLAFFKKALPALPISITMGLIFYFATSSIVAPFTEKMTVEQVYV